MINVIDLTKKQYQENFGEELSNEDLKSFIDYCKSDKPIEGVKQIFNFINCYAFLKGITSREAGMLWGTK